MHHHIQFLDLMFRYYGIDWATLGIGLTASYLIAAGKVRTGMMVAAVACTGGFIVAYMSHQMGFVVYNFLQLLINLRGVARGDRRASRRTDAPQPQPVPVTIINS